MQRIQALRNGDGMRVKEGLRFEKRPTHSALDVTEKIMIPHTCGRRRLAARPTTTTSTVRVASSKGARAPLSGVKFGSRPPAERRRFPAILTSLPFIDCLLAVAHSR